MARRAPQRALTRVVASATRVGNKSDDPYARRVSQSWQERSFAYYDLLGEVWYAAQFYARALSKLELFPEKRDPNTGERTTVDDPVIRSVLDRIEDPSGGRSNMLGAYGRLQFLVGEAYLFAGNDGSGEKWEILSTDELLVTAGGFVRRADPGGRNTIEYTEPLDDTPEAVGYELEPGMGVAYRLWRRHPRFSLMADSPMRGVLDLAEELLMLTHAVRARTRSRLAGAGILVLRDESTLPPLDPDASDEDMKQDPFVDHLTQAMVTPITDEGAASAVVPIVVRVSNMDGSAKPLEHVKLWDNDKILEADLRMDTIKRMAIGLDLPPEILLGVGDANHWSAWQVDEQSWKAHLEPIAVMLVEDLTAAYLRPQLAALNIPNPEDYSVAFDASSVISHPDRARDAKDLYDRFVISDETLRLSAGFDDDDAPSEAEYERRVGRLIGDASLAIGGAVTEPGDTTAQPSDAIGQTPADVQPGPPVQASARIVTAAELMVFRAREVAGSRLRSKFAKDDAVRALLREVPNRLVASVLGATHAEQINPDALVAGAGECFTAKLTEWGIEPRVAYNLVRVAEEHAAATLFDSDPGPLSSDVIGLVGLAGAFEAS